MDPRLILRRVLIPDLVGARQMSWIKLRMRERLSQTVFAHYLNVRKDAVSKWERGEKRPDGPSLKLLNLVKANGLQAIA